MYLYYGSSVGLGVYSFDTLSCIPKAIEPEIIEVGDINGDGYLDIMVAGREHKTYGTFKKQEGIIYVYYNDNGSFDDTAAYFYNRSLFHSTGVFHIK